MKRSIIVLGSVMITILVIVAYLFGHHKSPNYDFRYDKISQGDITVFVTATGTINAVTSVDVGTQVSQTDQQRVDKYRPQFESRVTRSSGEHK
jgi:HlyD family secretion protein